MNMQDEEPDMDEDDIGMDAGEDGAEEAPEDGPSALDIENADLKDKLLRALAETENVRRRAARDKEDTGKFAISAFARDLLNVGDNLRRAMESLPEEMRETEELQSFLSGIEMTEKEMLNAFEKHGIKAVNPVGEKFDHNFHQAMFEVESEEDAPGTVMQVIQTGYVIKDRLLRPAMVGVAKKPAGSVPGGTIDTKA